MKSIDARAMNPEQLRKEVNKIWWFHQINLGNGIVTPGFDRSPQRLKKIRLPEDLRGKTVLDIGAFDGYFSFEVEKRGAKVLAMDEYAWEGKYPWPSDFKGTKKGFELAKKILKSKVKDIKMNVYDLSPKIGTFDLVLFLGVLYHLQHPLLALQKIAQVTREQLILETHVDSLLSKRPAMTFYPTNELDNFPTNWWGPNPEAVVAMLKTAGFKKIKVYNRHSLIYQFCRAVYCKIRYGHSFYQKLQQNRMVFHAWK